MAVWKAISSSLKKEEERRGSSVARLRTKELLEKDVTALTLVTPSCFSWLQDESPPIGIEPDLRQKVTAAVIFENQSGLSGPSEFALHRGTIGTRISHFLV